MQRSKSNFYFRGHFQKRSHHLIKNQNQDDDFFLDLWQFFKIMDFSEDQSHFYYWVTFYNQWLYQNRGNTFQYHVDTLHFQVNFLLSFSQYQSLPFLFFYVDPFWSLSSEAFKEHDKPPLLHFIKNQNQPQKLTTTLSKIP